MFECNMENDESMTRLVFSGQATVESGQKIKDCLVLGLEQGKDLHVDADDVRDMDLCLVQACIAAKKTAEERGLRMTLQGKDLTQYLHKVGCADFL